MIVLKKLFFFFALLPFLSPVPLHTDVQPLSLLLATGVFFVDALYNRVSLNRFEVYFLLFALISFVVVGSTGIFELRHRVGILFAFFIYYTVKNYYYYLDSKVIKYVIAVHFIGVLWHYLSPSTFIPFAELFVRTIKTTEFTSRGPSGFAPENSFSAVISMVHIILLIFLYNSGELTKKSAVILSIMSIFVIIMSQSGSGYVYGAILFVTGLLFVSKSWVKVVAIGSLIILVPLFMNSNISSNRGGNLVRILIENPQYVFIDSSIAERWVGLHVGYKSIGYYPLGLGGGTYSTVASEVINEYDLRSVYPTARPHTFDDTVSSAARYVVEFGFIFLLFYVWIIVKSFDLLLFPVLASLLGFLLIFTSFSIAFPPTYILFAMAFIEKRRHDSRKQSLL